MTRVLTEQHISSRSRRKGRRGPAPRSRGHRPRPTGMPLNGPRLKGVRTVLLLVLTVALGGALAMIVPELAASGPESDVMLQASAPSLPSLRAGLVDFELTEDVEYMVSEGETLSEIARRYGIDYRVLAQYNDLVDPHTITMGQVIIIPHQFKKP